MRKVILASHGALSVGMLDSLRMIIGEELTKQVETFSLKPGESAIDFAQTLIEELNEHQEDEYVIVTDILGGSVHTALLQTLPCGNVKLFSGMSMSMLLELLTTTKQIDDAFVAAMKASIMDGIICMSKVIEVSMEEEDF